jgi:hypothetical protein
VMEASPNTCTLASRVRSTLRDGNGINLHGLGFSDNGINLHGLGFSDLYPPKKNQLTDYLFSVTVEILS